MNRPRGLRKLVRDPERSNTRQLLGLTQGRFAAYLGVSANRVADAEANRRPLTTTPARRSQYLDQLLLPQLMAGHPLSAGPAALPPPDTLPVPPPPRELSAEQRRELEWQRRTSEHHARQLRHGLSQRLALAHAQQYVNFWRRALLAAFADPPPAAATYRAASPDNDPGRTARFQQQLIDLIHLDEMPGGPLDPVALARDQLRLYLLEAEAATLSVWLAA